MQTSTFCALSRVYSHWGWLTAWTQRVCARVRVCVWYVCVWCMSQGLTLNVESTDSSRLAGQQTPETTPSLPPQRWYCRYTQPHQTFTQVLGIAAQEAMLMWKYFTGWAIPQAPGSFLRTGWLLVMWPQHLDINSNVFSSWGEWIKLQYLEHPQPGGRKLSVGPDWL